MPSVNEAEVDKDVPPEDVVYHRKLEPLEGVADNCDTFALPQKDWLEEETVAAPGIGLIVAVTAGLELLEHPVVKYASG